jgi:lysophospholipid acyltransferase (LPLAT)-like uncharacterized protein
VAGGGDRQSHPAVSRRGVTPLDAPSWDRTQIPKPFSTVAIVLGAPVQPGELGDHEILERRLTELRQKAAAMVESGRAASTQPAKGCA